MIPLTATITQCLQAIRQAEQNCHRPSASVTLIAASKGRSAAMIRQVVAAGVQHVGENYLQEALSKQTELVDLPLTWHFIGPIQANKTQAIAQHFDWVHSIERYKIANRLNTQRAAQNTPLNVLLQVNIDQEPSKSGATLAQLFDLAKQVDALPHLRLRGLMALPKATQDTAQQRASFAAVQQALHDLQKTFPLMDQLSMGTSNDWPAAIANGATFVRIGTQLFTG